MSSIHDQNLAALYQRATRGLAADADRRLSVDEMLALAAGQSVGARQDDALRALADCSDQAMLVRLLSDTHALSQSLSAQTQSLRRPGPMALLVQWWQSAGMPPAFASAGIALMAVIGFQMLGAGSGLPTSQPTDGRTAGQTESIMFDGAFEAPDQMFAGSLEASDEADHLFDGDFDS